MTSTQYDRPLPRGTVIDVTIPREHLDLEGIEAQIGMPLYRPACEREVAGRVAIRVAEELGIDVMRTGAQARVADAPAPANNPCPDPIVTFLQRDGTSQPADRDTILIVQDIIASVTAEYRRKMLQRPIAYADTRIDMDLLRERNLAKLKRELWLWRRRAEDLAAANKDICRYWRAMAEAGHDA